MAHEDAEYLTKPDKNFQGKCEGQPCYEEHRNSPKHGDFPVILMKVITKEKLTSRRSTSQMNAEKKKSKKV